ncbi:MAG: ferritin-like domain-containing protein [Deltaproteobacteria bacterium]|nr:ferritin-like domain-containing protein [Deltaproteobacteria bacterium]
MPMQLNKEFSPYRPENLVSVDSFPKLASSVAGSKKVFWDDEKVFEEILSRNGGKIDLTAEEKKAIAGLMSIIYYGEIVAMHTSAQLVGLVPDLAAQFVLSFQTMEETKHVMMMGRYLKALDIPIPEINPWAKKLLDSILAVDDPVLKLLGMNLIVENVAHSIFTMIQDNFDEPVLRDCLHYIDLDEVKHVALAKNYLPELLRKTGRVRAMRFVGYQILWNYYMIRAQTRIMEDAKPLNINWNKQAKRDTIDWINLFKEIPEDARRGLITPPSRKQAEWLIDWLMPPEKFAHIEEKRLRMNAERRARMQPKITAPHEGMN